MAWMAWTAQTATFFIAIAVGLVVMTAWELLSPTSYRRGFLPLTTTRGDRFFISLLSAAFIHLAWLGFVAEPIWPASVLAILAGMGLMRWG